MHMVLKLLALRPALVATVGVDLEFGGSVMGGGGVVAVAVGIGVVCTGGGV